MTAGLFDTLLLTLWEKVIIFRRIFNSQVKFKNQNQNICNLLLNIKHRWFECIYLELDLIGCMWLSRDMYAHLAKHMKTLKTQALDFNTHSIVHPRLLN